VAVVVHVGTCTHTLTASHGALCKEVDWSNGQPFNLIFGRNPAAAPGPGTIWPIAVAGGLGAPLGLEVPGSARGAPAAAPEWPDKNLKTFHRSNRGLPISMDSKEESKTAAESKGEFDESKAEAKSE
jgi:hypothetical protein